MKDIIEAVNNAIDALADLSTEAQRQCLDWETRREILGCGATLAKLRARLLEAKHRPVARA